MAILRGLKTRTPLLGLLPLRINLLGAGVVIELARVVVVTEVLDS
jgi:hypothetical protein